MNAASPEGRRIENHLRNRFTELWTDIRRELDKRPARSHAVRDAAREVPSSARADAVVIGPYTVALS